MSEISLETYDLPIAATTLQAIQRILCEHEVFCASANDIDCYDVLTFRREQTHHQTKIFALLDRNVLIDVLSIVRPASEGVERECNERGKIGAAIMAFLQCSNILIEPCIALYENPSVATDELKLFRQADNVETAIYSQLALGIIDKLPANLLPRLNKPLPSVDFYQLLKGRQKFRIAILKIAELDLSNLPPIQKIESFLRWSHEEFCFLAAPTLLAALHFTPHKKSTILHNLRAIDRNKALQSIQNAVWDIQIIYEWSRRVKKHQEEKSFWLLCSRDAALKQIAQAFYSSHNSSAKEVALRNFLIQSWGSKDGEKIGGWMHSFKQKENNLSRQVNRDIAPNFLNEMEQKLIETFISWRPNS
jgi:hypothetical protein